MLRTDIKACEKLILLSPSARSLGCFAHAPVHLILLVSAVENRLENIDLLGSPFSSLSGKSIDLLTIFRNLHLLLALDSILVLENLADGASP
jgi:hypothetical protein